MTEIFFSVILTSYTCSLAFLTTEKRHHNLTYYFKADVHSRKAKPSAVVCLDLRLCASFLFCPKTDEGRKVTEKHSLECDKFRLCGTAGQLARPHKAERAKPAPL